MSDKETKKPAPKMTSNKPYLIRALFEWITDNGLTPYIVVHADYHGVQVPRNYVQDGRIILNISPDAALDLEVTNAVVRFNASFGGVPMSVRAPVRAVLAIYARENGQGMVFSEEEPDDFPEGEGDVDGGGDEPPPPPGGKPVLTVVK